MQWPEMAAQRVRNSDDGMQEITLPSREGSFFTLQ